MALTDKLFDSIDSSYARVDFSNNSFGPPTQHIFNPSGDSHYYMLSYSEETHIFRLLDTCSRDYVPGNVIGYIIENDSHILIIADKSDSNRATKINLRTYNYEKKEFNDNVDSEVLLQMYPMDYDILDELLGFLEKDHSCQKKYTSS